MNELHWTNLLGKRYDSPNQAFFTRLVSQRVGAVIAALAFRSGLSPNTITVLGLFIMLAACLPFAIGATPSMWLVSALLWQVGFAFDCADGQLARATGRASQFGAWLDVTCDHMRHCAQALTVAYVLLNAGFSVAITLCDIFALLVGLTVYLHTACFIKTESPPKLEFASLGQMIRQLLRVVLDTPVFLLVLCLLRPEPKLLAIGVLAYGLLILLRGLSLGLLRLR